MRRINKFALSGATAAAITIGMAPISAQADILWTVPVVNFNDGGTLSGTFTTNEAGALQSWDLTTTAGTSGIAGFTYDSTTDPGAFVFSNTGNDTVQVESHDLTIGYLSFYFLGPLTLTDSPDLLEGGSEQFYVERFLNLSGGLAPISGAEVSGSVQTPPSDQTPPPDQTPVPEPMSLVVLGTALSGLAAIRRRPRT